MSYAVTSVETQATWEIREDYPIADSHLLETHAAGLRALARDGSVEALVAAARCTLHEREDLPVEGIVLRKTVICVRRRRERALMLLAIYHELGHAVLERLGIGHSHGDVWSFALALAYPLPLCRGLTKLGLLTALELQLMTGLPMWTARERLSMPSLHAGF